MIKKKRLVEYINVEGADFVASERGMDAFRIRTYSAAQEFVLVSNHNTRAGAHYFQDEATFNAHITDAAPAYFIVREDTNEVLVAAIKSPNNRDIPYEVDGRTHSIYRNIPYITELNDGTANILRGELINSLTLCLLPEVTVDSIEYIPHAEAPAEPEAVENEEPNDEIPPIEDAPAEEEEEPFLGDEEEGEEPLDNNTTTEAPQTINNNEESFEINGNLIYKIINDEAILVLYKAPYNTDLINIPTCTENGHRVVAVSKYFKALGSIYHGEYDAVMTAQNRCSRKDFVERTYALPDDVKII